MSSGTRTGSWTRRQALENAHRNDIVAREDRVGPRVDIPGGNLGAGVSPIDDVRRRDLDQFKAHIGVDLQRLPDSGQAVDELAGFLGAYKRDAAAPARYEVLDCQPPPATSSTDTELNLRSALCRLSKTQAIPRSASWLSLSVTSP